MTLRVLVFGRSGQVATELRRQAAAAGVALTALGRADADLADPAACAAAVAGAGADAVINAAAWTAVDRAEAEEAAATVVNGTAPAAMAAAAARRGLPFLHVSTDYVFDGSGSRPWRPDDAVAPRNAYGRSKLAGEEGVRAAGGCHAILRTSWVFSAHGSNFVKTMLRLSETRNALDVVEDQVGGPTPAAGIAAALLRMASALAGGRDGGTWHYAGSPAVGWRDFAAEIFRLAGREVTVRGIPTSAYPTPAARPLNSRLDGSDLSRDFGIEPADWRAALADTLAELGALDDRTKIAR